MTTGSTEKSNATLDDPVDDKIAGYLNPAAPQSFFLFAGAGSGKTRSLVKALNYVQKEHGKELALKGNQVGVITYTKAARDEIIRRIDAHPLFYVSTIHSFAWELIKDFTHDIREWLRSNLAVDIDQLRIEEGKGRAGTKASITRQSKIASKTRRLERLDEIGRFSYSPTGENKEPNSLNHSEVIKICSGLISSKSLMRWILVGRFPLLLIDESQDTNKHLLEALLLTSREHQGRFALGLIGDVMQRIYSDGKDKIEEGLPSTWAKPSKKLNHRCPKRIVTLINKIREAADTHVQIPRSDAIEGHVRLFIRSSTSADRKNIEDSIRLKMAEISGDNKWAEQDSCKMLTLEHHMAAKRLGFESIFTPLYKIEAWRTGLLDGTLPSVRIFTQTILSLAEAQKTDDKFLVAQIIRTHSSLVSKEALRDAADSTVLLRRAQSSVQGLLKLWESNEPTCGEVLVYVAKKQLLTIPDILKPMVQVLSNSINDGTPEAEAADPITEETAALLAFLEAPFSEIDIYRRYVSGLAPFDTHQGVKGLEFDRVMVILDDTEARGFMFGYEKLLGAKPATPGDLKSTKEGKETSIDRTRRLLYVTCSRAEKSLALVAYTENPSAVKKHVIDSGWFSENEIDL